MAVKTQAPHQLPHVADDFFSELPLGALYTPEKTTFRVFAPTATGMVLNLYLDPRDPSGQHLRMDRNDDGTWEYSLEHDCLNQFYTLTAEGEGPGFGHEVIDPYARSITNFAGRGIVCHDTTPVAARPTFPPSEAIIYELHLRDYSIDPDSGIAHKGKFLSLCESGTRYQGVTTGLDHLIEMGVNVVQILPFTSFQLDGLEGQYGWGYDSIHFNSPDGWYATRRDDLTRVRELKEMISTLHQNGIRVVMDMVYNHTMEDLFHGRFYSFEGLVPGYYYRLQPDGHYYNGSGVGNEFRSEAPMARRFILDSLKFWVNEYQIDGFRFDLMGLIDHDTVRQLTAELLEIDPQLLIYGEPWAAGTTPIQVAGKGTQRGLGYFVFNDDFRDAIKGTVWKAEAGGFVQAGVSTERVQIGIGGSLATFAQDPPESLNYVECHDNHTLWDRLLKSAPGCDDGQRERMDRMAAAILFTSQGIPFIQAGQEMRRTKGGEDNSYNLGDRVNMIHWSWKIEHSDLVAYYRGLIQLRRAHPMFRLATAAEVQAALVFDTARSGLISFTLTDPTGMDSWERARVLLNATPKAAQFNLPDGGWDLYVTGEEASSSPLKSLETGKLEVPARSAWVLAQGKPN